jgi:outer membrane immunogenic protein
MLSSTRCLSIACAAAVLALSGTAWAEPAVGPGIYLGVFGGYGEADATAREDDPEPVHYVLSGGLAGVQGGYDWASGSFVIGVAGDAAWSSVRDSYLFPGGGSVIFKARQEWEGSLRARAGFLASGALFYLTGGAAYSQFETQYSQVGLPFFVTDTDRWGWTAGAGFELPVADRWSVAAEYRYSDYGTEGSSATSPDGPYTLTTDRATLGLNYRF